MKEEWIAESCPHAAAIKTLSGKWTLIILHILNEGPIRFNELQRRLPNMTHATLSKQLKRMEADGLIVRKDYQEIPPRVEYALSDIGIRFQPVFDALTVWSMEYYDTRKRE